MKIIEKIEINYFRSFKKTEIYDVKDLNIFSGSNDSGKSNILRALNLFFNNEISPRILLDIKKDFNFIREEEIKTQTKGKKSIDITVHFILKGATKLRDTKFSIKKRWNFEGIHSTTVFKDKNWSAEIYNIYREPNIYRNSKTKNDASQKSKSVNRFLNTIFFFYVPAIKDEKFFAHIFGKLLTTIKENEEFLEKKKISDNIQELEYSINNETKDVLDQFDGIGMQFNVPKKLEDFFSAFDIGTTDLNKIGSSTITIKSRGDGIQAKLIPYLLELLEINQNKKTKNKNTFIWGFEEPENSFEYRNANDLAIKFKENYSLDKNRQVFITTHSFNFLSLEGENISKYRIFRGENNISEILGPIGSKLLAKQTALLKDENLLKLEDELGIFTLNKELEKIYLEKEEEKKKYFELNKKVELEIEKYKTERPAKIFICEDEKGPEIWKSFFDNYGIQVDKIYFSGGCSNFEEEIAIKKFIEKDSSYSPLVFRQNDRDAFIDEQYNKIKEIFQKRFKNINYFFSLLPVCEIENFLILNESLSLINEDKMEDIIDKTRETAVENLMNLQKYFDKVKDEDNNFYEKYLKCHTKVDNLMIKEARKNKNKFIKGKKICNEIGISDQQALIKLKQLELNNFPQELIDYLEEIKTFFNQ